MYSASELQKLHRAGKAYKLKSGAILPTSTAQELGTAITQAKAAHRVGGDEDDPGFRAHLTSRAAALGVKQSIPASWAHEQAGKSAGQWTEARVNRELRDAVYDVAKQARCTVRSMEIEYTTPAEAAEALAKASDYRRMAEQITDRATADSYRQLAKKTLQEAGLA